MLRLTVLQQKRIESERRDQFLREAICLLKNDPADQFSRFGEETLLAELAALSDTAATYGLVSCEALGVFIALAVDVGHDFHIRANAVNQVLSSRLLDETDKIEWLDKWYSGLIRYGAADELFAAVQRSA